MRVRSRMGCPIHFPYAGKMRGKQLGQGEVGDSFPPARFNDRTLQRDWKLRRIDLVVEDSDRAELSAATIADIETFQTTNTGAPLRIQACDQPTQPSTGAGKRTGPTRTVKAGADVFRATPPVAAAAAPAASAAEPVKKPAQAVVRREVVNVLASPTASARALPAIASGRSVSLSELAAANAAAAAAPKADSTPKTALDKGGAE